jgi:hypothetical protein
MNDDDLMTAVRNSFTSVHVTTPVEQITRRGRALRARRRIPALAGALAVAAAAALAVTSLHPGTPRASHQPVRAENPVHGSDQQVCSPGARPR